MSTALWIFLVVAAAAVSALIAFRIARRGAPTRQQLEALEQELEGARGEAEQVQAKVAEHFEKSALLFGQLAEDYRAFLEHFSDSAQALGLPERRARELLERGYQPLLTRESAAAAPADVKVPPADVEVPSADLIVPSADAKITTADEPAPPADERIATADATAEETVVPVAAAEATGQRAAAPSAAGSAAESGSARVVDVDLGAHAEGVPQGELKSAEPVPEAAAAGSATTRQQGGIR